MKQFLSKKQEQRKDSDFAYVGSIEGIGVFESLGSQLGTLYDVVLYEQYLSDKTEELKVVGIILELAMRKRVFVPITRITAITGHHVTMTGYVNLRDFKQRTREHLAISNLFDRTIQLKTKDPDTGKHEEVTICDIGIERQKNNDWIVSKLYVEVPDKNNPGKRNKNYTTKIIDATEVKSFSKRYRFDNARGLVDTWDDMLPADLAQALLALDMERQMQVVGELPEDRIADVLEELPEKNQVEIINRLPVDKAASIIEVMQPDDAADLIHELDNKTAVDVLETMQDEEADDIMQLLQYTQHSAGGIMTNNAIILSPETYVSDALSQVSKEELPPSIASAVMVARPPLETPTGIFLGLVHFQALLRVPPHMQIGEIVETDIPYVDPNDSIEEVKRLLTTYNQMVVPVLNKEKRLLGLISVDDVLERVKVEKKYL